MNKLRCRCRCMCAPSQEKKNKKEGAQYKNANANRKLEPKARALLALSLSLFPPTPSRSAARVSFHCGLCARSIDPHLLHTPHIPRSSWQSERSGLEPFVGSSFSDLEPEALAEAPYYAK